MLTKTMFFPKAHHLICPIASSIAVCKNCIQYFNKGSTRWNGILILLKVDPVDCLLNDPTSELWSSEWVQEHVNDWLSSITDNSDLCSAFCNIKSVHKMPCECFQLSKFRFSKCGRMFNKYSQIEIFVANCERKKEKSSSKSKITKFDIAFTSNGTTPKCLRLLLVIKVQKWNDTTMSFSFETLLENYWQTEENLSKFLRNLGNKFPLTFSVWKRRCSIGHSGFASVSFLKRVKTWNFT